MFFECTAEYVAYALMSRLAPITERKREVVQFVLELIPCYDTVTGRLRTTRDAHVLAQIYLPELLEIAKWHNYGHSGLLDDPAHARALLSVIVIPLVRHLCDDEFMHIVDSIGEADTLLSTNIETLNELVGNWANSHGWVIQAWQTQPIEAGEEWRYGNMLEGAFQVELSAKALPYPSITKWGESHVYREREHGVVDSVKEFENKNQRKGGQAAEDGSETIYVHLPHLVLPKGREALIRRRSSSTGGSYTEDEWETELFEKMENTGSSGVNEPSARRLGRGLKMLLRIGC